MTEQTSRVTRSAERGLHSSFISILHEAQDQAHVDPELARRIGDVVSYVESGEDSGRPFLSVLLRTQGRRLESLDDALLCLAAQTDQDFEVVIIDHDSLPADALAVRKRVDAYPEGFSRRVRVIEVSGGSRSRPLNAGLSVANGQYIAVYDDDDLLLADWVEQFHLSSHGGRGRILRSIAATQKVTPEAWPGGQDGFRTTSWPSAEYATAFSEIDHLRVNRTPFMSLAFPAEVFRLYGYRFDEELDVCEDWDMIVRASLLCGVSDVPALTSIYRRWQSGNSSYTDHSTEAWRSSEERVVSRIDGRPVILPAGSVSRIRDLLADESAQKELNGLLKSKAWRYSRPLRGALRVAAYGRRTLSRLRSR